MRASVRVLASLLGLGALLLPVRVQTAAAQVLPEQLPPAAAERPDPVTDQARTRKALEDRVARDPARAHSYLELARFELQAGAAHRAELILRTGLTEAARDPRVGDVRRGLVELLAMSERWTDALAVLESVPESEMDGARPLRARILVAFALEEQSAGDTAEAERKLRRATAIDPDMREGWIELASLLVAEGRREDARAAADEGLRTHPQDPSLLLLRASTLAGRERVGETVEALKLLRAERPGDVGVALTLAAHLAATGDPVGAMALHDTLLAAPEPEAMVFQHVAEFWLTAGDADSASVHVERGVDLHPRAVELWALRGSAREALDDPVGAAASFRQAASLAQRPAWLRLRAVRVEVDAGMLDEARDALQRFGEDDVALAAGLIAAEMAEGLGDLEAARWILRRSALRWGDDVQLREAEARVDLMLGDTALAVERYTTLAREGSLPAVAALRAVPKHDDVARDPGVVRTGIRAGIDRIAQAEEGFAAAGQSSGTDAASLIDGRDLLVPWLRERLDQNRRLLERIVDEAVFENEWGPSELGRLRGIYPGSVFLARVDVRLALERGDLERAQAEVERLLRIQPGQAELHALHGQVLEVRERPELAKESYGRAFELDPSSPEAFDGLRRLHRAEESLPLLLSRVQRLRAIRPDDEALFDREIELLHRLGRLDEARELTRSREGGPR